jgi:hypothetical protein
MLILTSNEDLIRQVSLNKTDGTHVVQLDFLAHLSDHNQSEAVKVSKKSNDHTCAICGDHASGYNYDVLSCGSCKNFFRRNAHQKVIFIFFFCSRRKRMTIIRC